MHGWQARRWNKLVPLAVTLAEALCEIGKCISDSDIIIEVQVAAPVQGWRRSGDPDKLGRCSSRAGINPMVHTGAGWDGWLRRWRAAVRDISGTSLLCLLIYALKNRAGLIVGKKGKPPNKRKKSAEAILQAKPGVKPDETDKRQKKAKGQGKPILSSIIASRCAAALKVLMKKDGGYLFLEPVDRALYPEYFKVIKKPIDLGTILRRVERNPSYHSTPV